MKSIGLALKLRPDCYEEYKRRHDSLWPELTEALHASSISMIIFRFGDFLFVHKTFPSDEVMERMNQHSITTRWNADMAQFLETDGNGNVVFQELPRAFAFGDFE